MHIELEDTTLLSLSSFYDRHPNVAFPKHPQLMIRVPPENPAVPWARPEGEDVFVPVTYTIGE